MKATIIAFALFLTACTQYTNEYHVAIAGLDTNPGTKTKPFRTISAAAQIVQPGDKITVHEGVYRERINPPRGGLSNEERIVYEAAKGEKVVIKGSEIIKNWQFVQNDTWKVLLSNKLFGDFNPYTDRIHGEWYHTPEDGYDRHTGAVYLNGQWLSEAPEPDTVLGPAGEKKLWFARVDHENTTIWAQFPDTDPNTEKVEINVRQCIFYPDQPGRNYITVRGFTMRHAATPWAGAMSEQIGLIGTHWSKGWIIEDNVISHSMNTGITLGHCGTRADTMPPATSQGYVAFIRMSLDLGWSTQNIGSHNVRNNHISHCEKNGIHGSLGGVFSTIEGNTICDIAVQGWSWGPDRAGLKLLASHDVLIRDNHIYRCGSYGGIWLDWMAQGTRVTGNFLHDNARDLFVEVNHGPFMVDNNLFLSPFGVLESCGGGAYVHNLFDCQINVRAELTRETPFHKANCTEIAGLSKVIGDDERFYNNLFVGHLGLSVYGEKSENLQATGNVYLAGAMPSQRDSKEMVVADLDPGIQLIEKPEGWWLEICGDSTWASQVKREVVTTKLLGSAMVPSLPFENPDGTPYRIDTDYFGEMRDTVDIMPGPFHFSGETTKTLLKVWPKR